MSSSNSESLFERVSVVFEGALELPVESRVAFVEEVCAGDAELLREVRELLTYHERSNTALDAPLVGPMVDGLLVGQTLGNYLLEEAIGEGGMGIVYRAADTRNQRKVAVKVLRIDLSSRTLATRFRLEGHTLKRLKADGIASLIEVGTTEFDGRPLHYYAMELIEGPNLRQAGLTDLRDIVGVLAEICDAIGTAHAQGIVHRDIKPENIIVQEDGHPVVLDFGISRTVDPRSRAISFATSTGHVLGTVAYMSPEQLVGDSEATGPSSDIYSLGVLAFEMLTGTHLFQSGQGRGRTLTQATTLLAIERGDAPLASSRRSEIPPELDAILAKSLERRPEDRYQNGVDLAADFRMYLAGKPVLAPRQTALRRGWSRLRRSPKRAVGIGAIALGVVLAAGAVTETLRDRQEDRLVEAELSKLWTLLINVNRDIQQPGNRSEESILRALDDLQSSRKILEALPRRPFNPRLARFIEWRSGEARLFLGYRWRDVSQFYLAAGHWNDALDLALHNPGALEGLDPPGSLFADIKQIDEPIIMGGIGNTYSAIAGYRDRCDNLRRARDARANSLAAHKSGKWSSGGQRKVVERMATLDWGGAVIDLGVALDNLPEIDRGIGIIDSLASESEWRGHRAAYGALEHKLGMAYLYRWEHSGLVTDFQQATDHLQVALGIRGEGTGSRLYVWDRFGLAQLNLWAGRRLSLESDSQPYFVAAQKEIASMRAGEGLSSDPELRSMVDALQAEVEAELARQRNEPSGFATAESLLVVAELVFNRDQLPLQYAELQLARAHVLIAAEPVMGPRDREIEQALNAIERIVPGGIWPWLQNRAEAIRETRVARADLR